MALEALLWDVDGTLAETEEAHRHAFNRTFAEFGLPWEWSQAKYRQLLKVTGGVERITHFVMTDRPKDAEAAGFAEMVKALHKAKTVHYVAAMERGEIQLRPGVERLLTEAREAGMRLAISTTTSPANVSALINNSRDAVRMDWFEVVGAGNIVPKKKPAPDIYQWTLAQLDLPPGQCVALEDSRNGLFSALGAGIPTVITYSSYTDDQTFEGALAVADCFGEPDAPAQFRSGDAMGEACIDLAMIRRWHAAAVRKP